MSLKVGYVIFYVAFLSIFSFFQLQVGTQVLDIEQSQLFAITVTPTTGNTLIDSLTFLFNTIVFAFSTLAFLVTIAVSPDFILLNIFVVLPLSAGFLWSLLELARGN